MDTYVWIITLISFYAPSFIFLRLIFSLFYFSFLHSEIRFSFKFHFSFNSYFQFCNFSFWYYYFIFLYILRPRRLGHGKQGVCGGSLKGISAINRSTGYVHRAQVEESQRSCWERFSFYFVIFWISFSFSRNLIIFLNKEKMPRLSIEFYL